jgi:hypothetical protein
MLLNWVVWLLRSGKVAQEHFLLLSVMVIALQVKSTHEEELGYQEISESVSEGNDPIWCIPSPQDASLTASSPANHGRCPPHMVSIQFLCRSTLK